MPAQTGLDSGASGLSQVGPWIKTGTRTVVGSEPGAEEAIRVAALRAADAVALAALLGGEPAVVAGAERLAAGVDVAAALAALDLVARKDGRDLKRRGLGGCAEEGGVVLALVEAEYLLQGRRVVQREAFIHFWMVCLTLTVLF